MLTKDNIRAKQDNAIELRKQTQESLNFLNLEELTHAEFLETSAQLLGRITYLSGFIEGLSLLTQIYN